MRTKTAQENFWTGTFGEEYTDRNVIRPEERSGFFQSLLSKMQPVKSICELGANRGHNLAAINVVDSNYSLTGVEINDRAFEILKRSGNVNAIHSSIQDFEPREKFDLVFCAGVLIHINPDDLPAVYQKMAALSKRYVMMCEYFNSVPIEVEYRNHSGVLFKRDFAAEFLDVNEGQFGIVDYGFLWNRHLPAWDNQTWFLLERIDGGR